MFLSMMMVVVLMICFDFALFHYYYSNDDYFSRVNLYLIDLLGHSVMDCQFPMVWLVNFVAKQVDYFYWYCCYRCQRCPPLQPAVATITTTLNKTYRHVAQMHIFLWRNQCMSVSRMEMNEEKKINFCCVRRWGDTNAYIRKYNEQQRQTHREKKWVVKERHGQAYIEYKMREWWRKRERETNKNIYTIVLWHRWER